MERRHYYWYYWVVGAAVLLLLLLVPAYKGYGVYRAMRASGVEETYMKDMAGLQQAKDDAEKRAAEAERAAREAGQAAASATSLKEDVEHRLTACETEREEEKATCDKLANSLVREKADLEEGLESARDGLRVAANRLCCIQKVLTPEVVGYELAGDAVTCTTDGGTPLQC